MATDTRPGFRFPWGTGAGEPDDQSVEGVESGAEEAQEPTMIETTVMPSSSNGSEPPAAPETADGLEPSASPESSASPDENEGEAAPQSVRRATKFMAELSRAMQAAVETARTETMARFEVEAKSIVDEIHAGATSEASELRSNADSDVAAIRDWSKSEIARIREETESRITARKAALDDEMVEHAATIEARTERVAAVVAAYEAELAAFFERLNAEEDPTRIATMAESMPEPPSLADVASSITRVSEPSIESVSEPSIESVSEPSIESVSEPSIERLTRLLGPTEVEEAPAPVDFAAAEAEAASLAGEPESQDDLPEQVDEPRDEAVVEEPTPVVEEAVASERISTRVVVSGLVSVANIANFKRSLGRLPGVSSIAVASGRDGDFAFTVGHTLGSALSDSVQTLPGFDIEITGEHDGAIVVTAKDRDAND